MKNFTNYEICLPVIFALLLGLVIYLDLKYNMLRDSSSTSNQRSYSFSKTQLAFWLVIILSSFISIIICVAPHNIPTLSNSSLIVLGISTATLAAGRLIDISDQNNPLITRSLDESSQSFMLDILSDQNGVSLHRLQCFIFNLVIGCWTFYQVFVNLSLAAHNIAFNIDTIIPEITPNNLVLLGLSAGTYIALKTNENTPVPATQPVAPPPVPAQPLPVPPVTNQPVVSPSIPVQPVVSSPIQTQPIPVQPPAMPGTSPNTVAPIVAPAASIPPNTSKTP
jgi:hypothetical protein